MRSIPVFRTPTRRTLSERLAGSRRLVAIPGRFTPFLGAGLLVHLEEILHGRPADQSQNCHSLEAIVATCIREKKAVRVEEADRIAFRFGLGPARSEDWSAEGLVKIASNVDKRTLRLDVKQRFKEITDYESRRRSAKTSGAQSEVNMEISRYYNYAYQSDLRERVKWAAQVDHPFLDRLLAFWSNHFFHKLQEVHPSSTCRSV